MPGVVQSSCRKAKEDDREYKLHVRHYFSSVSACSWPSRTRELTRQQYKKMRRAGSTAISGKKGEAVKVVKLERAG